MGRVRRGRLQGDIVVGKGETKPRRIHMVGQVIVAHIIIHGFFVFCCVGEREREKARRVVCFFGNSGRKGRQKKKERIEVNIFSFVLNGI